jgi:hypothetical protein
MEFYWPMRLGLDKTSTGTKASGNALIDSQAAGKTQYPKSLSSQPSKMQVTTNTQPTKKLDTTSTYGSLQPAHDGSDDDDAFDRVRKHRFGGHSKDGWRDELRRYLDDQSEVSKDINTLEWWHVSTSFDLCCLIINMCLQRHSAIYPTLARMALDILPIPASSVGCERLFSRAKEAVGDRRTRLGSDAYEAIECLNFHWRDGIADYAAANSANAEEVFEEDLADFVRFENRENLYRGNEDAFEDTAEHTTDEILYLD